MTSRPGTTRALFVSHQASRTGAPIVLLHLLRWLRAHTDLELSVLLLHDGPLRAAFAELAPVHVLHKMPWLEKVERACDLADLDWLAFWLRRRHYGRRFRQIGDVDLLYLNATSSFRLVRYLPSTFHPRVIGHVHELEMGIDASLPVDGPLGGLASRFDRLIACSQCVASELLDNHGIDADKLTCHYEFVAPMTSPSEAEVRQVRTDLKIPDDAVVIGNVATIEWRKGPELFVQLAAALRRRMPARPMAFVWVGASGREREFRHVEHEVRHHGLSDDIRFVAPLADVRSHVRMFDVFALTSREDPFPLSCLEASMLGTPVVAFDDAGGMPEFLLPDCGRVVPYADVDAMADAIIDIVDHPDDAARLASNADAKVRANHSVEVVAPQILDDIRAVLASPR